MASLVDGFEKDLENELMCPVCLKLYEKPYRLDCQHAFCQRCLQKLVKSDSTAVVCPACRHPTTLKLPGFLGIAKQPLDLQLCRLVEKYKQRHGSVEGSDDGGSDGGVPGDGAASDGPGDDPSDLYAAAFEEVDAPACCEVLHGYIPFDIPPDRTFHLFSDWTTKLWLSPTDFSRKARLKTPLRKVAVPFYVYSLKTQIDFKATVLCPQDSKTSLPPSKVSTTVKQSRVSAPTLGTNADPCANHESRRWLQNAIGSTVTHTTARDGSQGLDPGWGTWLWHAARPVLSPVLAGVGVTKMYPHLAVCGPPSGEGGCAAPAPAGAPHSPSHAPCTAAPCGPAEEPSDVSRTLSGRGSNASSSGVLGGAQTTVDNLELGAKVGQTYVSSTQPMQRRITLSGKHSNYYNNMLVCASYGVNEDLVATLMTGYSKENDLTLMKPITVDPPRKGRTDAYLHKVRVLMDDDEGTLSGLRAPRPRPAAAKADDGLFGEAAAPRARRPAKPAKKERRAEDPSVAYDELLRAPSVNPAKKAAAPSGPPPPLDPHAAAMQSSSSNALDDFFDSPKLETFEAKPGDGLSTGGWGGSGQHLDQPASPAGSLRTLSMLPTQPPEAPQGSLRTLSSFSPPPLFDPKTKPARPTASHSDPWVIGDADGASPPLGHDPEDPIVDTPLEVLRAAGGSRGAGDPLLTPTSDSDDESPPHPTATRLVQEVFVGREDYFALDNAPPDADAAQSNASYTELEILAPERTAEDAWLEYVWPHTQEKEMDFTKEVIHGLEPRGAVLEASDVELTVTELKQKAVLIPCYVATYEYDDREYDVLMHGRTGEVHGMRPWIGTATLDHVKRNMGDHVASVRTYVEDTLDHLGVS